MHINEYMQHWRVEAPKALHDARNREFWKIAQAWLEANPGRKIGFYIWRGLHEYDWRAWVGCIPGPVGDMYIDMDLKAYDFLSESCWDELGLKDVPQSLLQQLEGALGRPPREADVNDFPRILGEDRDLLRFLASGIEEEKESIAGVGLDPRFRGGADHFEYLEGYIVQCVELLEGELVWSEREEDGELVVSLP
jgi:hypothetical protein